MTREEPEFLTDIGDFTTLFYVILKRKFFEWLESSIESDLNNCGTTLLDDTITENSVVYIVVH